MTKRTDITEVDMAQSVTNIGTNAFRDCSVLTAVGAGGVVTVDLTARAVWGSLPQTLSDGTRAEYREAFVCDIPTESVVALM